MADVSPAMDLAPQPSLAQSTIEPKEEVGHAFGFVDIKKEADEIQRNTLAAPPELKPPAPVESAYTPPLDMFAGMTTNVSNNSIDPKDIPEVKESKEPTEPAPLSNASAFAFLNATSDSSPNLDTSADEKA